MLLHPRPQANAAASRPPSRRPHGLQIGPWPQASPLAPQSWRQTRPAKSAPLPTRYRPRPTVDRSAQAHLGASHRGKVCSWLRRTMDDGRWTMDDGRWTMDDGRRTMDDGRRTMDDGRWTTARTNKPPKGAKDTVIQTAVALPPC